MNDTLTEEQKAKNIKSNKRTLYIILIVSIAPIALAYFSFFTGVGVPDSTSSYGRIINPARNIEPLMASHNAEYYQQMLQDKKWHLFLPVGDTCNEACEQNLYVTRQVHIRLGEKSVRVDRTFVYLGESTLEETMQTLKQEHPLLKGIAVDKQAWRDFMKGVQQEVDPEVQPYYVLVDQEGFAMMLYDEHVKGGDLLKDLKRALKHSIDYQ